MNRINSIKEFLKTNPGDSFLQHALALEYIKIGNEAEARLLFETILFHDPDYIGSYYHLAKLLERTGEGDEAIRIYKQGMAYAEKNGDRHTYNELMGAYEEMS